MNNQIRAERIVGIVRTAILIIPVVWICASLLFAASESDLLPDGTVRPGSRITILAGEERDFRFRPEGVWVLEGRAILTNPEKPEFYAKVDAERTQREQGGRVPYFQDRKPFLLRLRAETKVVIRAKTTPEWEAEERKRMEEARKKSEQEQRERLAAQQRAEQARQAKERADRETARQRNWNDFSRRFGVRELVDSSGLFTNPFLYQGKNVAVTLSFDRMMTANSAIFEGNNSIFVVSNIPTDTYRSKRERDLLAVSFLGMTEIKGLPMVSSMQVPNLRFVGVHFCQDWSCSDILTQR